MNKPSNLTTPPQEEEEEEEEGGHNNRFVETRIMTYQGDQGLKGA